MKSLRLLLLLLMLSFTGIIKADELVIQDFQLLPEQQTSVAVELNNTDRQYIMLDFFIQLPSGVTIARDEDDELMYELNSTRARRSHSLDIREQSNGSYRVLLYSSSNEALKGTSGAVFTMTLEADASATSGDYTGALTNQLAMDINKNKLNFLDKSFNVLIKSVQQPQSLSLENLPVMTYGDADYTLPAKTDQNQTLTWSSNNSSVATISGNTLTVKGAGTATITASQGGSESYTPFSKTFTLTVNKAALTVTADDCSRMEGAANPAFTISYSGFKYNDNASSLTTQPTAATEATTSSPAGTYPITVSGGSSDNYEFNYVNGTLTVTAKNNQTISLSSIPVMTYGDGSYNLPSATDQGLAITWSSNNTSVATVSGNTLTVKGAGVATITASQAGNGTYNSFSKTFTLTVNKTPLTITADDKTKTAGQANPSLTVSYSGFVNGESSSVLTTQPTVTTTATASSAAGTYPITVSGAAAANYEIIYVEGTLTVVKADQNVTLTAIPTMTYGDAAYTLPAKTAQNQTLTWASNNTSIATVSGNTLTVKGAGTATITASQAGNETYNPFSKSFTLTVNKAVLTVTADDCSRMEGVANPAFTISYSGFKYNDNASSLTTQPTAASEATTSSPAGTYPITVSGGSSDNYEFNYVNGTLTVTAKNNQTISLSSIPVMTYGDGSYNLPSATDQGLAITWSSNNTSVATVSDNTLTVKGAGETSVTAANDGDTTHNPFTEEFTLTVNKATLTVTADDQTKTAGDENPEFTVSYSGFVNDDNVSSLTTQPTAASEATTSSPAGTYLITVSGGSSDNYEFNYVNGTLTVTEDNEDLYIQFADDNVKALCVANWDTNGDGELSMNEAAAVTDLGSVFDGNKKITSFDELQYFTGLTSIGWYAFSFCRGLTSISIPSSVTSIGNGAFSGCNNLTSITIPSSVTSIGGFAFHGCSGLTSITIPSNVTSIGGSAFSGCTNLTSITIPESVTSIGYQAFLDCNGLTSISIPSSVTSIGDRAFSSCIGLASISVDSSNQYYNDGNGRNCIIKTSTNTLVAGCKNTDIPSSVTSIGGSAFWGCTGLTSITIPSNVTSIGGSAFSGCSGLASISVDSSNQYYNDGNDSKCIIETSTNTLVAGCKNTVIPSSVTSIGGFAFYDCTGLTSITIPSSVTSIGGSAFFGCTGLTSITIPSSVTSIGDWAFSGCKNLTSITIPSSVTSIGDRAFSSCIGLTSIISCIKNPFKFGNDAFYWLSSSCILYVPAGTRDAYIAAGWTEEVFKGGVVEMPDREQSLELTELPTMTYGDGSYNLPSATDQGLALTWSSSNTSVATVSGNTLTVKGAGETSVTAANDGDTTYTPFSKSYTLTVNKAALTVTADDCSRMEGAANPAFTISYSGFKYNDNASSLTTQPTATTEANVSSPSGTYPITVSGGASVNYEFNYVNGTLTVVEDNQDLYIQFADATVDSLCVSNWDTNGDGKLSYEEAAAVTNLGTVFEENKSITSFNELKYFTGLSSIGLRAFRYCSSLTNIIIPEGVTSIGNYAFYGCRSLSSITIPNSVTTIGIQAFHGDNDSQTSIVVESGNIVYDSRNNCNALIETSTNTLIKGCRNTVIPKDVVAIGDWAFSNCSSLTSITIPNSVTSIGDGVFNGCTGLTNITIPNRVTTIGAKAFNGCNSLTLVRLYSNSIVSNTTDSSNLKDIFGNQVQTYILGSGVTSIGDYAFNQCNNISISIGGKVKSIGEYAFYGCTGLTSITFKDGTSIGDYAFYGCTGLTSITFKDGTSIGDYAFYGCTGLTSVVIPQCSDIGKYCFGYCTSLLSVKFGNGNNITAIPRGMFVSCHSLTSLGVIGSGASIEIPNSVTFINKYAFGNCSGLKSITIPNSVTQTYTADSPYTGCTGLENLVIGNGLTSIPDRYFVDCKNLKSVTIGTSVTSIGYYAFDSSKLAQVRVCNPTPITISSQAFPYRSTATLVVPSREAKSAYKAADYWKDFKLILFEGEDFSNVLEVSDMVVDHGAFAELPVKMTNQDKITAVEFDLEMPSGFKLLSCSLTERKGDHGINYAQSENGSYHVTIFSLSSSVFTGSTGDLFTLHLLADSLGQHIIAVKNVELSTNDGDKRTPQDISASVTICDIPIGDVNGDGEVTITDAVSIVNHRLNRTPVRFISAAADLNADNEITITDAVRIVNMILSDQSNAKLRTESAISLPEPQ